MIIGACGFGSTGSSAVSDYLQEFEVMQVLDSVEFTWVSGVDGFIDLKNHLFNPHTRTSESIIAINRFKERAKSLERSYQKVAGIDAALFKKSIDEFLSEIIDVSWNWYYETESNPICRYLKDSLLSRRIIPFIEKKLGHSINVYPMQKVNLSVMPLNFESAAKKQVNTVLKAMGATFDRPIVLDQPFSGNNPQACFPYFDDPYAIVVDRDPRDNYVFAKTKLLGRNHFMACDNVKDFVKYYKVLRCNQPYLHSNERVLSINFEDMVYHYEYTTKKIRDFLNLPENPKPKTIFKPELSMPNTQVWKRYPQFADDINYIEQELTDYLFDYTGCPEPDVNGKMFYGRARIANKQ